MKKILLAVLLAASTIAATLASTAPPTSAAVYDGTTYEEMLQDPTLHNEHSIVIRFYAAVFARTPDNGGIRFWLDQYDGGEWSTRRIADFFVTSDEFKALYGDNTSNAQFVDAVYPNVLGRQPDANGRAFWIGFLDQGNSRAEMVLLVSNSPEFINANPLPSDGRAIPTPVDTTRVFDGLMGYNNVAFPAENDMSKGTNAWWYGAYLNTFKTPFQADLTATSRTPISGGYRYTLASGEEAALTNPVLDASGRLAHFDINGDQLLARSETASAEVPELELTITAYQFISSTGRTSVWLQLINESTTSQETFSADWRFTDSSGAVTAPSTESGNHVIPAEGFTNEIAIFDANGLTGGTVELQIFVQRNGTATPRTVTIDFG